MENRFTESGHERIKWRRWRASLHIRNDPVERAHWEGGERKHEKDEVGVWPLEERQMVSVLSEKSTDEKNSAREQSADLPGREELTGQARGCCP